MKTKSKRARLPAQARRLMMELMSEIKWELDAAGDDEVRHHPSLLPKKKLLERAKRYLDKMGDPDSGRSGG